MSLRFQSCTNISKLTTRLTTTWLLDSSGDAECWRGAGCTHCLCGVSGNKRRTTFELGKRAAMLYCRSSHFRTCRLLWSKQFYHYVVEEWLVGTRIIVDPCCRFVYIVNVVTSRLLALLSRAWFDIYFVSSATGDAAFPPPPPERRQVRIRADFVIFVVALFFKQIHDNNNNKRGEMPIGAIFTRATCCWCRTSGNIRGMVRVRFAIVVVDANLTSLFPPFSFPLSVSQIISVYWELLIFGAKNYAVGLGVSLRRHCADRREPGKGNRVRASVCVRFDTLGNFEERVLFFVPWCLCVCWKKNAYSHSTIDDSRNCCCSCVSGTCIRTVRHYSTFAVFWSNLTWFFFEISITNKVVCLRTNGISAM